jgi:hypothetical protein
MTTAIPWVTGGLTLVAFIFATTALLYRRHLRHEERLIDSAPESDRAQLLLARYGAFDVKTENLTKHQQYDLAKTQIHGRAERFKIAAITIAVIGLILAAITIVAIIQHSEDAVLRQRIKDREQLLEEIRVAHNAVHVQLDGEQRRSTDLLKRNERLTVLLVTFSVRYPNDLLSTEELEIIAAAKKSRTEAELRMAQLLSNAEESIARLEGELFRVSTNTLEKYVLELAKPDFGAIKLLPEGKYDRSITVLNGGSWYSFLQKSHNVWNEADISLTHDDGQLTLATGFKGLDFGFLLGLGDVSINDVSSSAEAIDKLPHRVACSFIADYQPPTTVKACRFESFKAQLGIPIGDTVLMKQAIVQPHSTYLLRSINSRDSDLLVALRVEDVGRDESVEIIWHILRRFQVPNPSGPEPYPWETEMADMLAEELGVKRKGNEVPAVRISDYQKKVIDDVLTKHLSFRSDWLDHADEILALQRMGVVVFWPPVKGASDLSNNTRSFATSVASSAVLSK